MTQSLVVMHEDTDDTVLKIQPKLWFRLVLALCFAILVGFITWMSASFFADAEVVSEDFADLTVEQHTALLVRSFRISAAHDATPSPHDSIPEAASQLPQLVCGSHYVLALEEALIQLYAVNDISTLAGARQVDALVWREQQADAHAGFTALHSLFPDDCEPVVPVVFDIPFSIRSADGIALDQMLPLAPDLVNVWSELYVLAETSAERELAKAGLRQVIAWESTWGSGQSSLAWVY